MAYYEKLDGTPVEVDEDGDVTVLVDGCREFLQVEALVAGGFIREKKVTAEELEDAYLNSPGTHAGTRANLFRLLINNGLGDQALEVLKNG